MTFVLSSQPNADHVHVAGDFNDWQASTPMKRQKDGSFRATVELEPGREYQFRYLVDGNNWVNDEAADGYVPNPFGADNSVVRTPKSERIGRGAGGSGGGKAG
ncbi:MAG TPA: isoamylase early set domain-containing protein, partial [Longimicrobiales bacterium]